MALLALGAAPALAQQSANTAPGEVIEVTGSRIKNTDAQSANPITVVSAEDINKTETVTVEQYLRKLPDIDFTGGNSQNDVGGGDGASNLGLRNLGPERTLILVNGQRFPQTDSEGSFNAVDLNNIPTSMIDHIDILRDGASSAYGADAVGGVINIITKQHFNGVEIGGMVGETSYGDGLRYETYSTMGSDFDRGNILVNVSHDHQDEISSGDRSWAIDEHPLAGFYAYGSTSGRGPGAVGVVNPAVNPTQYYWYGVGSAAASTPPILAANAYLLGKPLPGGGYAGGLLPPGAIALPAFGGVFFDYLPTEGLIVGLDRTQVNLSAHYDLAPGITAILEAFYTDRRSTEFLNPEPLGAGTPTPQFPSAFLVPAFLANGAPNPANPTTAPNAAALFGADNVDTPVALSTRRFEDGDRLYTDDLRTYRIRAGLEGTLAGKYDWQVGYFYGVSDAQYSVANEANFYHISQMLGINPCGTAAAQGCSIANFFGYQTLTPAQAQYMVFDNASTSALQLQETYGNISGPIYQLPAGPLTAAVGFEYRTDGLSDVQNSVVTQGDAAIFEEPTQGGYATASTYAELNIPILANMDFVKQLTADVSSRYDYNTIFGRALTYKAGLDWAVTDDIRFRGNHSTGFRAPQVKELFAGPEGSSPSGTDPCAANGQFTGNAQCLLDFQLSGLSPNTQPPQINQLNAILGGNPQLKPETSSEWTFGTVLTPHEVPGLTVTVDYYTVLVRNEISTYNAIGLLNACYGGIPYVVSQAASCQLVNFGHRAADGSLPNILTINTNIGDELTQGIDVTAGYGFEPEKLGIPVPGHVQVTGSANYLIKDTDMAEGVTVKNAGTWNPNVGGGTAEPRWKALLDVTYSQEVWSVDWTERYYGGVHNVSTDATPDDFPGNEAAGVFYSDLSGTYKYKNVSVTLGVDNLFDKDPPFLQNSAPTLTDAGYDYTGRFIYMKGTVTF
jgi:iron complex outermembrane receptor protein